MDEVGFVSAWTGAKPSLVRFLKGKLQTADIDDVLSQVMYVGWRRRDQIDKADDPVAWFMGVTKNIVRNLARSTSRRTEFESRTAGEFVATQSSHAMGRDEKSDNILRVVSLLKADDRTILMMKADGFSNGEVAEMLQVTEANVRLRIHRVNGRILNLVRPETVNGK